MRTSVRLGSFFIRRLALEDMRGWDRHLTACQEMVDINRGVHARGTGMRRWIAFLLIVVCLATTTDAFAQEKCDGPFKGKTPTDEQLAKDLANHKAWMDAEGPDGDKRRANLCDANLSGANLSGARLIAGFLIGTNLSNADLTGVDLRFSDLTDAVLTGATLTGVIWGDTTCPDGTNTSTNGDGNCDGVHRTP